MTENRFSVIEGECDVYDENYHNIVCRTDFKEDAINVCKLLNELNEENAKVKHEFENAMIDYHILIEKNPLDKYYKNAEWALKELYKDLFGDEAYGGFLANYRGRIKEREELLE